MTDTASRPKSTNLAIFLSAVIPSHPPADSFIGLELTKNRAPPRVLVVRKLSAYKENPWNSDVPRFTYVGTPMKQRMEEKVSSNLCAYLYPYFLDLLLKFVFNK